MLALPICIVAAHASRSSARRSLGLCNQLSKPLRCNWHLRDDGILRDLDDRCLDRGSNGGNGGYRARLADSLDPFRVVTSLRSLRNDQWLEPNIGNARNGIVRPRRGPEIPVGREDRLFEECVSNAMHDAAMKLAFHDHGVDIATG